MQHRTNLLHSSKEIFTANCKCRATGGALTIGGDGRADSPGHSAKFGLCGIIDLTINKVIHLELVQASLTYDV